MAAKSAEQVARESVKNAYFSLYGGRLSLDVDGIIKDALAALRSAGYITEPSYVVRCGETAGEYRVSYNDQLGGWVARFCGENAKDRAEAECSRLNAR